MPKLPILKPREIIKKFEKLGFIKDHQTGSHVILYHPKTKKRATVPYHQKDISSGFLGAILKQTDVTKEKFLAIK